MADNGFHGKELLLVGTVHRDPEGAAKLLSFLRRECPGAVGVEVSPFALFYRRREGRRLQRRLERRAKRLGRSRSINWRHHGQIQSLWAQFHPPFEYRAAMRYCRDTGAGLSCLDSSFWSRQSIRGHWPELLSSENLKMLFWEPRQTLQEMVQREYELAARLLERKMEGLVRAFTRAWLEEPGAQERETLLAEGVGTLCARTMCGRVAYIGGWQHLLGSTGGGTLYERLEPLRPKRVLLPKDLSSPL